MIIACQIYEREIILLLFQDVQAELTLLESVMPKRMDLELKNFLPIGKNTVEMPDQKEMNKWQRSATM